MLVIGIDPGSEKSGCVLYSTIKDIVIDSKEFDNNELIEYIRNKTNMFQNLDTKLFVETIEGMGLAVGKSTFDTCIWIGRILEAWRNAWNVEADLISRGDEKIVLCGTKTFINKETGKRKAIGDVQIRQAVIDRFAPTGGGKVPQVGTKSQPGPLYGVSGHCWQALAIALTGVETKELKK